MFQPPKLQTEYPVTWTTFEKNPEECFVRMTELAEKEIFEIPDSPDSDPDRSALLHAMIVHTSKDESRMRIKNLVRFLNENEVRQMCDIVDVVQKYGVRARVNLQEEILRKRFWIKTKTVGGLVYEHLEKLTKYKPTFTRAIIHEEDEDEELPSALQSLVPFRDEDERQRTFKCSDDGSYQRMNEKGEWETIEAPECGDESDTEEDEEMMDDWSEARAR